MARLRQPFLVAAALAFLLAAGMGEENPAPIPPAVAPAAGPHLKLKPDVVPGDNPRVDLEVDAKSQLMLAPVTVNGVEGRFVLGTGAPTTLVTPDFAGKTGLDRTAVSVGVVGGGEDAKLSRVQSLKVGATNFANFDIRILALGHISQYLERPPGRRPRRRGAPGPATHAGLPLETPGFRAPQRPVGPQGTAGGHLRPSPGGAG